MRNSSEESGILFEAYLVIILRISDFNSWDKDMGGSDLVRVRPLPAGPLRSAGVLPLDVVGTVSVIVVVELSDSCLAVM